MKVGKINNNEWSNSWFYSVAKTKSQFQNHGSIHPTNKLVEFVKHSLQRTPREIQAEFSHIYISNSVGNYELHTSKQNELREGEGKTGRNPKSQIQYFLVLSNFITSSLLFFVSLKTRVQVLMKDDTFSSSKHFESFRTISTLNSRCLK